MTASRPTPPIRIVHEGRGGHVQLDDARYPIEHVGDGRFVVHVPARAPRSHREALAAMVASEPDRWSLA